MRLRSGLLFALLAVACSVPSFHHAVAQSYPARPISIVVPFPPGGNSEFVLRHVADRLSASLGQPVVIENRPGGAGGAVGAKAVASANPDGYTLLYTTPGPLTIAPSIYKNLGYDPVRSFTPVAMLFSIPQMLVMSAGLPVTSMQDLVGHAKANPGKISYASPGYGTQSHLLGEMFRLKAGINVVHVPFKGPAQAITDLLGGRVQIYFDTVALFLPHIKAGRLTPVAMAAETRISELPEVPTTAENGFPSLQSTFWAGLVAPRGVPSDVVTKLNVTINEILQNPELGTNLAKMSAIPKIGSPEAFAAFMADENHKWERLVSAAGIKAE